MPGLIRSASMIASGFCQASRDGSSKIFDQVSASLKGWCTVASSECAGAGGFSGSPAGAAGAGATPRTAIPSATRRQASLRRIDLLGGDLDRQRREAAGEDHELLDLDLLVRLVVGLLVPRRPPDGVD